MPPRRVQVLFALVGAAEAALLPFLPIVLDDRGLSPAQIGLVLGIASAAGFVATPLWGHAADRRLGAERALMCAAVAAAAAATPLAFVDGFAALTLAVVVLTAIRASMTSLLDALALEHLRDARNQYGRVRLWQSVGWMVSACVWGAVLELGNLTWLPAAYAACALAVAFAASRVHRVRDAPHEVVPGTRRKMLVQLAPFLLSLLLLFAAFSATFSFVSVRLRDLGGGLFVIGAATALQAGAEAPVMRLTPRLSAAFGHRLLYALGSLFFVVSFGAWAFLHSTTAIALVKLVAGVGFALVYVGAVVLVDDLVPPRVRGTGQGLAKAVSFGLAPILGSVAGGATYDYAGPRALFLACAGSALVAGIVVLAYAPRPAPIIEPWTPKS